MENGKSQEIQSKILSPNGIKGKITLHTGLAFMIWAILMVGAFVFIGYKPEAGPYFSAFAMWLTVGLGALTSKRLIQKKKEFTSDMK